LIRINNTNSLKGGILMPRVSRTAAKTVGSESYMNNGVYISPAIPSAGDSAKIVYDGLLSKSGAAHVYARIGYGSKWDNLHDYPMSRSNMGFEATIPVIKSDTLNVCFKDCANNWDNNSGRNYSFDVTQ